jgi:muconolactone delta-isomerase
MEYLVTMTTHVPEGTSDAAVQDIRAREAAHSRDLAAQGHLLRLWRPPLQPGEWRSLGLFAAGDADQLEAVLASMPLRVWRSDEVTPLAPHPNDPAPGPRGPGSPAAPGPAGAAAEFLTTFIRAVPDGTPAAAVADAEAREAQAARELGARGLLVRLWALPEHGRALGLWRAPDADAMQAVVTALPLYDFMRVETTPLTPHPSDPALAGG